MASQKAMSENRPKPAQVINDGDEDLICPLCMEVLDETDRNFFPCTCDYQVCLWCLHYIRTTMGNKCPACRRDYEESNMKYKSNSHTPAPQRNNNSKKKRDLGDKDATTRDERMNSLRSNTGGINLKDIRVIQRNLVYVVGIPGKLAKKEILKQNEYFGQYGKIQHLVLNKSQTYNSHLSGNSYTAYVTYSKKSEAAAAIQGIDGSHVEGKLLRASYGTTKYCTFFFKGLKCTNPDCFYLHHFCDERELIVKEDLPTLMHKPSNPPFGVIDPWNHQGPAAKTKEDSSRKRVDSSAKVKTPLSAEKHKEQEVKESPSTSLATAANDKENSTWANIAAGSKEFAPTKSLASSNHVAKSPEETQVSTSTTTEVQNEQTTTSAEVNHQSRTDSDQQLNGRFMSNFMSQIDLGYNVNYDSSDPYDIFQCHFNSPLLLDLQRYNRYDHMFYVTEVPQRSDTQSDTHETLRSLLNAHRFDDEQPSHGYRWVTADELKVTGESNQSRMRMQLDHYREVNKLSQIMEGESVLSGTVSTLGPRDLFSDRDTTDAIIKNIKRHSVMLNSLAKLYGNDLNNRKAPTETRAVSQSELKRSMSPLGLRSPANSIVDYHLKASPTEDRDGGDRQPLSSILFIPSLQESQLEHEMKLHEDMVNQTQRLLELQIEREKMFVSHLLTLGEPELLLQAEATETVNEG